MRKSGKKKKEPNPLIDHPAASLPKQKRGWRTRSRLMRSAVQLFSEKGYDATTTNQVSRKAGVSVGIFYKYFRDKREIFFEIYREYSTQVEEAIAAELESGKWREANIRDAIRSLVRTAYESHKVDPGLMRAFAQIALKDPEFQEARNNVRMLLRKPLERLLQEHGSQVSVSNSPVAAFIIDESVEACVHQVVFFDTPFGKDEFLDEMAKMISAYLTHSSE